MPASFRGLPVYTSYPIDTDFNGAPISLLERDRMCGEYFYICHDEEIAIFSAEHDKFITISYEQAKKKDVRFQSDADGNATGTLAKLNRPSGDSATAFSKFEAHGKTGPKATAHKANPPILIFRPFQTVSKFTCLPVARSYLSHNSSLLFPFAITVDDGKLYPYEGRVGARQHVP